MGGFFYYGRADALCGLIPNPLKYGSNNSTDYNDYLNGYISVQKNERPSRGDILKMLDEFVKNGKK